MTAPTERATSRRLVLQFLATSPLFAATWGSPVVIAPTGGNRAHHPDGELAVSKAAQKGNHLQVLSTSASTSIDEATKARGGTPIWFQLYASPSWDIAKALIKRAENAGSPVLAITVDRVAGRNQETFARLRRTDTRDCTGCHDNSSLQAAMRTKPNYDGIDIAATGVTNLQSANMTWDFIKKVRDLTKMKIVIKGILASEDAAPCVEHGVDGMIVSNHGARGAAGTGATSGALPGSGDPAHARLPVRVSA